MLVGMQHYIEVLFNGGINVLGKEGFQGTQTNHKIKTTRVIRHRKMSKRSS